MADSETHATDNRVQRILPTIERLHADLASAAWQRIRADLLSRDAADHGYRLLIAGKTNRGTA
ncbi:hypothetical protein ACFW08_36195 [Streptomyces sp. NPDC058960]|uniref:hypothetical protein n=1 Tax=Streptomyces sp. NPDC058960 TaxID=3346679 RepID=UPI0036C2C15B